MFFRDVLCTVLVRQSRNIYFSDSDSRKEVYSEKNKTDSEGDADQSSPFKNFIGGM